MSRSPLNTSEPLNTGSTVRRFYERQKIAILCLNRPLNVKKKKTHLKMLLAFILGDERGFNILKTLFSVLFEWFDFK